MFCKVLNFSPQIEIRFFFHPTDIFTRLFWLQTNHQISRFYGKKKVKKYSEDNSDLSSIKYFCVLIKGLSI